MTRSEVKYPHRNDGAHDGDRCFEHLGSSLDIWLRARHAPDSWGDTAIHRRTADIPRPGRGPGRPGCG